jgi:hypothetical protein
MLPLGTGILILFYSLKYRYSMSVTNMQLCCSNALTQFLVTVEHALLVVYLLRGHQLIFSNDNKIDNNNQIHKTKNKNIYIYI